MLLFGGATFDARGRGGALGDTLLVDASAEAPVFTVLETEGPVPRYCACATYDRTRGDVLLVGGRGDDSRSLPPATWTFHVETATWTELETEDTPEGVTRETKCLFEDTRRVDIPAVAAVQKPSEIHGRAVDGCRRNSRYVMVALVEDGLGAGAQELERGAEARDALELLLEQALALDEHGAQRRGGLFEPLVDVLELSLELLLVRASDGRPERTARDQDPEVAVDDVLEPDDVVLGHAHPLQRHHLPQLAEDWRRVAATGGRQASPGASG
jgi:hypothetical protein